MFIVYSEERNALHHPVKYHNLNATGAYINHYNNSLLLSFIARESDNFAEKAQARKELAMAEKKMDHWKKHPNFNAEEVQRMCEKLKADWSAKR